MAERLRPVLCSAFGPRSGLRRALFPDESSQGPLVQLMLDGEPASLRDLPTQLASPDAAFEAAFSNLDTMRVAHRKLGDAHVYEGDYAAELILSSAFRRRLHDDVAATKLLVAVPERGYLFVADARAEASLLFALDARKRTLAEPITEWVLCVERGELRGRARIASSAQEALAITGSDNRVETPPKMRDRPGFRAAKIVGQVALVLACIVGLATSKVMRAAMTQREDREGDFTMSPPLIASLEASSALFDAQVDAVEVKEEQGGAVLVFSSSTAGDDALVILAERMRREATRRRASGLRTLHARLTAAQAPSPPEVIRELAEALQSSLRSEIDPDLVVTITVQP